MKRFFKIMPLGVLMLFLFVGASSAKTRTSISQQSNNIAIQQKLMNGGLVVRDRAGINHVISYEMVKARCSNAANGKRGWWGCLKNFIAFYADLAEYYLFCDDTSTSSFCDDLANTLVNRYVYDLMSCSWISLKIKSIMDSKANYAKRIKNSADLPFTKSGVNPKADPKIAPLG